MAEEQHLTGERANRRLKTLLKNLGWEEKSELERDVPCEKRSHKRDTHGIDGFLAYDDPYTGKRRGVTLESKSKKWASWRGNSLQKAATQSRTALECVSRSEEFNERISLGEDLVVDSGILGAWTNDVADEDTDNFDSEEFDNYVDEISIKELRGGPYHLLVLANDDLNRIASIHNQHSKIRNKYTEGTDPQANEIRKGNLEFFYPSIHEPKSAPQRREAISYDYLYSDIIYSKLEYTIVDDDIEEMISREVTIVYLFDEFSYDSLEYLYQALKENGALDVNEIWVYVYTETTETDDSDFEGMVNDAKSAFFPENKEYRFEYLPRVEFKSHTEDITSEK